MTWCSLLFLVSPNPHHSTSCWNTLLWPWVLEYLYLINIQSVQCVHHSPSVLSLHCCTCPVCYPTHRPILDLAACRATPACQVIYYPAYTQDLAGYIPLLEYRTDLGVTRLPLGHLVNIFLG